MSGRRTVRFSLPILEYLKQLIAADLDQTDLAPDRRGQAKSAIKRINIAIMAYQSPQTAPTHKVLAPHLAVPVELATDADWRVAYQRHLAEKRLNHA